jgi:endonuclease/exonuclease/phosphatase family metal-dependent hydrolase
MADGATLRVLTQNLWAKGGDWSGRRRVIQQGLAGIRPDLIAFQEAILTPDEDQAAELLDPDFHVFQQRARDSHGAGLTIATRWPIARAVECDFRTDSTGDFNAGAILALVQVPKPIGPVVFANFYPTWRLVAEAEREAQAVRMLDAIEGFAAGESGHVILVGDLDADPDAASIRFWTGRQALEGRSTCYRDAFESAGSGDGSTFGVPENPLVADHDWPFRRIDYILVRCGEHGGPTLAIRACTRAFDQPTDGVWASDHFGVFAELGLP